MNTGSSESSQESKAHCDRHSKQEFSIIDKLNGS